MDTLDDRGATVRDYFAVVDIGWGSREPSGVHDFLFDVGLTTCERLGELGDGGAGFSDLGLWVMS
jgi:hypothetical protein